MKLFDISQAKIVLVVALLSIVLGVYDIKMDINRKIETEKEQLTESTRNLIRAHSYAVEQSYLAHDISSLDYTLEVLSEAPYFQKATFYDDKEESISRKTLASAARHGTFKLESFVARNEGDFINYLGRIVYEGKFDPIYKENKIIFWNKVQKHMLVTLILAFAVFLIIERLIKDPLKAIESALDYSLRGNSKVDIPYKDAKGEIGRLATTIEIFKTKKLHALNIERKNREKFESLYTSGRSFLFRNNQELRAPLHGINGYTELLLTEELTQNQRKQIENIQRLSKHIERIANSSSDFAEKNLRSITLNKKEENIKHLIENVADCVLPQIYENKNHLHLHIEEQLPAGIKIDAMRFEEIIFNLLSNAAKFTHEGDIHLYVQEEERTFNKLWLKISISDTGEGMTEDELNSYIYAESTDNVHEENPHIGMIVIHKLINLMGGSLTVESKKGVGSTFSFAISCEYNKGKTLKETASYIEFKEPQDIVAEHNKKPLDTHIKPVLIVDDDIVHRDLLKKVIESMGYAVITAENGLEALKKLQLTDVNMIFMDLMMPTKDGIETANEIRLLDGQKSRTPIIAVTANCREGVESRCLDIGMDDFLTKPFHIHDVQEKLSRYAH